MQTQCERIGVKTRKKCKRDRSEKRKRRELGSLFNQEPKISPSGVVTRT